MEREHKEVHHVCREGWRLTGWVALSDIRVTESVAWYRALGALLVTVKVAADNQRVCTCWRVATPDNQP